MKSENKICYLYALLYSYYFLVFVLLLQLFAIPVHAAGSWTLSSNVSNHSLVVSHYYKDLFQQSTYSIPLDDSNYFYAVSFTGKKNINRWDQLALYAYRIDGSGSPIRYSFSDARISILSHNEQKDGSFIDSDGGSVSSIEMWFVPEDYSSSSERGYSYVTSLPFFESVDAMNNYCLNGDKSGLLNGGSDFDPHDDAYAFTGFSMSGKTATWTGTTERSYLLDMDVNEWVNYTYGFATSEDQEVSSFIDAEANYPTFDKKLALPWDEMEANKKEGEFIRQVNIIPCYGTSGAGFYFGLPCKVFYHRDGSVDKVELPASNGILSSDMERPVIVLNEASNGNPVGGDYSYFRFNNAQDDYFIEMKGRWYSTNDFDIYRENLVWKYKYQTILKNDLSSWVSVSDGVNSVGSFRFDVLGKSSWENLLSLYPVDNRNFEGGSFALFNKITGYSDALDTLKMLLKQPYSLYNGYEIYVRYYRYDDNGNLQYSKWTHFYNNLADAAGSSGSRLDDLNNMYSENQSDKGLTDDELSDLENTGNSRNDLDAVPKYNYDYSSLENATMNFFDLLTNFGTMLGQFPSMVAAVFGFLPSWLIGLIAVAIGAVIFCRFIGR